MTSYTQDSFPIDDADADARRLGVSLEDTGPGAAAHYPRPFPAGSERTGETVQSASSVDDTFSREPSTPQNASTTSAGGSSSARAQDDWLDRSGPTVPPLDRVRPSRAAMLPQWAPMVGGIVVALLVAIVALVVVVPGLGRSSVPKVIGLDVEVARTRLAQDGLGLRVVERRFSSRPVGLVLVQSPAEGERIKRNSPVRVVVSAGTEEFSMPDVVGEGQLLAKGRLEAKGLEVRIETIPSEAATGTVLSTNPGPGQLVHTGDIVRVVVAVRGTSTKTLLPYDLRGVTVVIDPEPTGEGQSDVPLDIARRLRSLIEASQGKVIPTRALVDTGTAETPASRAQRAVVGTATAAIGLSVVSGDPSGVILFSPSVTLPQTVTSGRLATRIVSALGVEGITAKRSGAATDTVLGQVNTPWARLQLGSYSSKDDVAAFTDPSWEDMVARGLYRAIGEQYGKKGLVP